MYPSSERAVTVALAGDLGLTSTLLPDPGGRADMALTGLVGGAGAFFCSLEFPMRPPGAPIAPWAHPSLAGSLEAWPLLERLGVSIVNLATNHVLDAGRQGLLCTIARCRASGILTVGAGLREEEARAPAYVESCGSRIGFLGYCKRGPFSAEGRRMGAALLSIRNLEEDIPAARRACDALVVSMHMGMEFSRAVLPETRRLAQTAIELGADCVVGHHPHVLNAVENRGGRPVFYSLGNLLLDNSLGAVAFRGSWEQRHTGAVAIVEFGEAVSWTVHPTRYAEDDLSVGVLAGAEREQVLQELAGLGELLGCQSGADAELEGLGAILRREVPTVFRLAALHGPAFLAHLLRDLRPRHLRMLARLILPGLR